MKISIITTTFNSEKTVKDTIESVLKQTYSDYEHIFIDGKSTDKTLEIIKSYENEYNGKLKYISEPDKGIYDAMNKGIRKAKGKIIGFLNSDDIYAHENVLKEIIDKFKEDNYDGIHGNLVFTDEKTMTKVKRIWKEKEGKVSNGWHPAHPTLYLKKDVYDKYGLFDIDYKIVADYDFMIRILKDGKLKLGYIDDVIVHMRLGGASTNGLKGYYKNLKESHKALLNNKIDHPYIVDFKRILKTMKQIIIK